jgi:hypothetical protein
MDAINGRLGILGGTILAEVDNYIRALYTARRIRMQRLWQLFDEAEVDGSNRIDDTGLITNVIADAMNALELVYVLLAVPGENNNEGFVPFVQKRDDV